MLNKEKYANELIDMCVEQKRPAVTKDNRLVWCNDIETCEDCAFNGDGQHCMENFKKWLNSEYVENRVIQISLDVRVCGNSDFILEAIENCLDKINNCEMLGIDITGDMTDYYKEGKK